MQKLYITDLDGTLLDNSGIVPEKSVKILNNICSQGALFSVATSRSLMTARELIKNIKISAPVVLMSGVFIYDLKSNKPIKYFKLDYGTFYKLMSIYEKHNKSPFVTFFGNDNSFYMQFTDLKLQVHRDFYDSRSSMPDYHMSKVNKVEIVDGQEPVFISLCDTYEDLFPIKKEIDEFGNVAYSFYKDTYTPYWFLEVFAGEASKAKGLEVVKNYTNADRTVAFGDNLNDIPMLLAADESYAVSNAVKEVKTQADAIIASNEGNGVALFIEKDFLY